MNRDKGNYQFSHFLDSLLLTGVKNQKSVLVKTSDRYLDYYTHLTVSSRTTWVRRYQKGKTSLYLNESRNVWVLGWQWHQLDHIQTVCSSPKTENHTNTRPIFTGLMLFLMPSQQCQSTEGKQKSSYFNYIEPLLTLTCCSLATVPPKSQNVAVVTPDVEKVMPEDEEEKLIPSAEESET